MCIHICSSDGPLGHNDNTENGGEDENDVELEGAVGGVITLPTPPKQEVQEQRSGEKTNTSLLEELQKEIDRLHLLSPGG